MRTQTEIAKEFKVLKPLISERARRTWVALQAKALGWGGVTRVSAETGVSRNTICAGIRELNRKQSGVPGSLERIRRPGAGRKRSSERDATLMEDLGQLVDPDTAGDPESPLRWTSKSAEHLTKVLRSLGHKVSRRTVANLLKQMGHSLRKNIKELEGGSPPDRDKQFRHIQREVKRFTKRGEPVISVDTKKKELVGNFRNAGVEQRPKGRPDYVNVYDFPDDAIGKAIPYGVYEVDRNVGWVSVGVDHETPEFAVQTIRAWWSHMGRKSYPKTQALLITADCGGGNGNRSNIWKLELSKFAKQTGLTITVCHLPPGTSKWNKIEHRMFSQITQNWRGRPLVSYETVVSLIGTTRTSTGLRIRAKLDPRNYPKGKKATPEALSSIKLKTAKFRGEWNYTISP